MNKRIECKSRFRALKDLTSAIEASCFTYDEIAAQAGVSKDAFYRWNSGRRAPTLPILADLAEVLGLEVRLVPKEPS